MERIWYVVLRIAAGLGFLQFGLRKWLGFPTATPNTTALWSLTGAIDIITMAACALIIAGLFTRAAAGVMAAISLFHFSGRLSQSVWPVLNGGTLDLLFFTVYVYIAICGAGAFSLDAKIRRT
jgi:putative oxidoreductase